MAKSKSETLSRADRRKASIMRNAIKLSVTLPDAAGGGEDAQILNISATGVLLETSRDLNVGDVVSIDLLASGVHHAQVMWKMDGMVGCQFLDPLSKSNLSAALLKSEALPHEISPQPDTAGSADEKQHLGLAIALARKAKGMRQGDLAKEIGVSTTTVCKWEQGHVRPRAKALARLESCLGRLDQIWASPIEPSSSLSDTAEDVPSSVLHECKMKIAKVLGVRPEAISWQLQIMV